jgi:hypothetical protein
VILDTNTSAYSFFMSAGGLSAGESPTAKETERGRVENASVVAEQ